MPRAILPATSLAAYSHVTATSAGELRSTILAIIESSGSEGCIMDDVFAKFPESSRPGGTISSRFSELENERLIFRRGDTRPGESGRQQGVMRAWCHLMPGELETIVMATTRKRNPFLAGMIHAAKMVAAASDLTTAKATLKTELLKAAKRSAPIAETPV